MPAVAENLLKHLEGTSRIGRTPESTSHWTNDVQLLEQLADTTECTMVETGSPIGMRMASLAREAGITEDLPSLVTHITASEEGSTRMEKFIRHQMVRRSPINPRGGFEGPKLTGHETLFLATSYLGQKSDDPNAVALAIALEGIALQKGRTDEIPHLLSLIKSPKPEKRTDKIIPYPPYNPEPLRDFIRQLIERDDDRIITMLQSRGFQRLPLTDLRTVNDSLAAILTAEQDQMSIPESVTESLDKPLHHPYDAESYRARLLKLIHSLPQELRRIYYFERAGDIRILYAVPKIQEQIAALSAPNLTHMAELAQELELPLTQEYIGIAHELIKMVSRGIEPVTRHILEYQR